ncbi:thaumatin-like protein 1 [Elaeis guineensis]|uniref:thaumatin-like protein 1 n=1 Tax=Elaeis guineensis var. tenera TaxID=51953 RepID=UPI003C6D1314
MFMWMNNREYGVAVGSGHGGAGDDGVRPMEPECASQLQHRKLWLQNHRVLQRWCRPPVNLAEFTFDDSRGMDFYDINLVDGYNVPILIVIGCEGKRSQLKLTKYFAYDRMSLPNNFSCKSACDAFGSLQYCYSGAYGNPNTCKPLSYSQFFKNACPRVYSYAYDDASSTFTYHNANYLITFCPSTTRLQFGNRKIIFEASGVVDCYIYQIFLTTTNWLLQLIDCLCVNSEFKA